MIAADLISQMGKKVPLPYFMPGDEPLCFDFNQTLQKDISNVTVMMDYYPGQTIPDNTELLVLHHPPKFGIPKLLTYVIHSGWDAVPNGAGDALADVFGLTNRHSLNTASHLGRVGNLPDGEMTLNEFAQKASDKLHVPYLTIVSENPDVNINTVAVVSGFGLNSSMIKMAKQNGADVLLSGDLTHHDAILAKNLNIALIDATHYATELPGLYRLRDLIAFYGVKAEVCDTFVPWRLKIYENY